MPKVSIIMGVYNGERNVRKSIESMINQTFTDWEFIICDDGSEDGSYEVLKKYSEKDERIRVIRNDHNSGLAKTLNHCLEIAQGEYIARMDDDDFSYPNRLEKQVLFLDNHPTYDIVASGRNMVDEYGIWGKDLSPGERTNVEIFKGNFFPHPTVMIRKKAYDKVQGYSTYNGIGREEDTDLWCKLYANGSTGYVLPDILLDYFESRTSMSRRRFKYRIAECRIKLKYRKELGIPIYMILYAFKPAFAGLIPNWVMMKYHYHKFE